MGIAKPGTLSQYPFLVDSLAHENRIAALDLEGTAAVHCFREKSLRYFPSTPPTTGEAPVSVPVSVENARIV